MKITSATIFLTIFSLAAIIYTFKSIKNDTISIRSAVVWFFLWFIIGFFSLFPSLLDSIMLLAQMQNRMFFISLLAVFTLFALVFNINAKIENTQRMISKLAQEIAIINYKIEKNDRVTDKSQK